MCDNVKNTSIVPFTAGSGINYSGEYNSIGSLEFIDSFSFFSKIISSSMLAFLLRGGLGHTQWCSSIIPGVELGGLYGVPRIEHRSHSIRQISYILC